MLRSIELIVEKLNLLDSYTCKPIINHKERLYELDGVNAETRVDCTYLIYDCSGKNDIFDFKQYQQEYLKKSISTVPVMLFQNWTSERKKYNKAKNKLRVSKTKKELSELFEKKVSIYIKMYPMSRT